MLARLSLIAVLLVTSHPASAWKPEIGERPEPLDSVEYVDGTSFDVTTLRGRPAVLYFGADWCVPCIERGRPTMVAVAKKYVPQGLQVVYINMDDNKFRANKIAESKLLGIPMAMAKLSLCAPGNCPDGLREMGRFGRVFVYPTAVVLDADGVLRAKMDRGIGVQGGLDSAVAEVMKATSAVATAVVASRPGPFDGDWATTLACPATETAKGYSHRFPAQIKDSRLRAVYGTPGEPGWQSIEGDIGADGSARLSAEGLVGNADFAAGNSPRGKSFAYDVDARFDRSSGLGQRTKGRICSLRFTR